MLFNILISILKSIKKSKIINDITNSIYVKNKSIKDLNLDEIDKLLLKYYIKLEKKKKNEFVFFIEKRHYLKLKNEKLLIVNLSIIIQIYENIFILFIIKINDNSKQL